MDMEAQAHFLWSTRMNSTVQHVPHTLGEEDWFCELRTKHYGEHGVLRAGDRHSRSWIKLKSREHGLPVQFWMQPGAYYSSSLPRSESWSRHEWEQFLKPLRSSSQWDLARFNLLNDAQAAALERHSPFPTTRHRAHFSVLSGSRTYAEYLKTRRSSFNANQRRCLRNMTAQNMEFTRELSWESIVSVFASRHQVKSEEDYSITPAFLNLLKSMRERLQSENRWWEVGIRRGDRLVAFTLGYRDEQGVWSAFQTAYDPEFHSLRLGALTFEHFIEWALDSGCTWITFLGDSPYFEQFSPERHEYWRVDLHRYNGVGLLLWISRKTKPALRLLRKFKRRST